MIPSKGLIPVGLAKQLRSAGLLWRPAWGDLFHIPDRQLDDQVFVLADLSVEVTTLADGLGAITFNGAVEWSLDYILTQDVVWMPSEVQLRSALGHHWKALRYDGDMYRCEITLTDRGQQEHSGPTAAEAYGLALLRVLQDEASR